MIQGQGGALLVLAVAAPGGVAAGWTPVAGPPGVSEFGPWLVTGTGTWAVLTTAGSAVLIGGGNVWVALTADAPVAAPPVSAPPTVAVLVMTAPGGAASLAAAVAVAWALGALRRCCGSCAPAFATIV